MTVGRIHVATKVFIATCAIGAPIAVSTAVAQDNVMVVFDASGSMYGAVDGTSKLDIAKKAVGTAVGRWQATGIHAGLIAYGHRRKRDCSDIETIVEPGPINLGSFQRAVNKLQARGNTPLTEAVLRAAKSMDSTRRKATVILMSDGKETCDKDPCAIARELERTGAEFTAHVIALRVKDEDEANLQCLASETGGRYIRASSETNLAEAFAELAHVKQFRFTALTGSSGRALSGPVEWTLRNNTTEIHRTTPSNELDVDGLSPGRYHLTVRSASGSTRRTITIRNDDTRRYSIVVGNSETYVEARSDTVQIDVPHSVRVGEKFVATWSGPNEPGDKLQLTKRGAVPGLSYIQSYRVHDYNVSTNRTAHDLAFTAPTNAGDYELRYFSRRENRLLDRKRVTVTKRILARESNTYLRTGSLEPMDHEFRQKSADLFAVRETEPGLRFEVHWKGPGNSQDWIAIANPDSSNSNYSDRSKISGRNPVELRAPSELGRYELRYVDGRTNKIIARQVLTVR